MVLQQIVAAARRKVQPVSVVFWELDGLNEAPRAARDEALNVLAAVAWRTIRESDTVFGLGESAALGVLVDTAEPGAVVVADRVQGIAQTEPGGRLTHRFCGDCLLPVACARPRRTRRARRRGARGRASRRPPA